MILDLCQYSNSACTFPKASQQRLQPYWKCQLFNSLCVCVDSSNPPSLCGSAALGAWPLILQSRPPIASWNSLLEWLTSFGSNLNFNQRVKAINILSAAKSPNKLCRVESFNTCWRCRNEGKWNNYFNAQAPGCCILCTTSTLEAAHDDTPMHNQDNSRLMIFTSRWYSSNDLHWDFQEPPHGNMTYIGKMKSQTSFVANSKSSTITALSCTCCDLPREFKGQDGCRVLCLESENILLTDMDSNTTLLPKPISDVVWKVQVRTTVKKQLCDSKPVSSWL